MLHISEELGSLTQQTLRKICFTYKGLEVTFLHNMQNLFTQSRCYLCEEKIIFIDKVKHRNRIYYLCVSLS